MAKKNEFQTKKVATVATVISTIVTGIAQFIINTIIPMFQNNA